MLDDALLKCDGHNCCPLCNSVKYNSRISVSAISSINSERRFTVCRCCFVSTASERQNPLHLNQSGRDVRGWTQCDCVYTQRCFHVIACVDFRLQTATCSLCPNFGYLYEADAALNKVTFYSNGRAGTCRRSQIHAAANLPSSLLHHDCRSSNFLDDIDADAGIYGRSMFEHC